EKIGITDNFFVLGGHSLKGVQIISRIYKELSVEIPLSDIFKHPVIAELSQLVKQKETAAFKKIEPAPEREYYDISHAQRRLWVINQLEAERIVYNMPAVFDISGPLNIRALTEAFRVLIRRHDSLRTCFTTIKGVPKQIIRKHIDFSIQPEPATGERLEALIRRHAEEVFDLTRPPLFRVRLLKTRTQQHILLFNLHHIISDGWSLDILMNELALVYNAYTTRISDLDNPGNPGAILPPLPIQYKDYTLWQNRILGEERINAAKNYWHRQFPPGIPISVTDLPTDYPRPPVRTSHGGSMELVVDNPLIPRLNNLCRQQDCTLFMVLLASVILLIYRYTGQEDVIVGSPAAGRDHPDLEDQVGFYVNTLPLRLRVNGNHGADELLQQTRQTVTQAYQNQIYPFDQLVDELNLDRDTGRHPLFDVMLSIQNKPQRKPRWEGIHVTPVRRRYNTSKFDLTFDVTEGENDILITIEYNTDLFKQDRIRRLGSHFMQLMHGITGDSTRELRSIDLLTERERHQLLIEFNNTAADYPKDKTIGQLVEGQVEKTPDRIAVVHRAECLTYRSLNEKADQLAGVLINKGVTPETIVGLMLER
ncbi:MAG: AMP-binding protein, partial [bacterium]|nr:AMP-binding protein [bacterium]